MSMVMIRFNISIKFATTKAWGWLGEPRIRNTLGSSCTPSETVPEPNVKEKRRPW